MVSRLLILLCLVLNTIVALPLNLAFANTVKSYQKRSAGNSTSSIGLSNEQKVQFVDAFIPKYTCYKAVTFNNVQQQMLYTLRKSSTGQYQSQWFLSSSKVKSVTCTNDKFNVSKPYNEDFYEFLSPVSSSMALNPLEFTVKFTNGTSELISTDCSSAGCRQMNFSAKFTCESSS